MSRTNHHGDKKKAKNFSPWKWFQSTPSWWTRLTMNRPQRRAAHDWERKASTTDVEKLEEVDTPSVSKKPHQYFY